MERNSLFGNPIGRRPKESAENKEQLKAQRKRRKKESAKRNGIEGCFGVGKRKYDLDLVKAKTAQTSESWIATVLFVMNIAVFMKAIFLSLLGIGNLFNIILAKFKYALYQIGNPKPELASDLTF